MGKADQPSPPDRLRRVAEAMLRAGQIESAASCYAELRKQGHELAAGPGLLRCLCRLGRWPEALQAADELERIHPTSETLLECVYSTWYDGRFWRLDPSCSLERLKTCADRLFGSGLYERQAPYITLGTARAVAHFEQWDRALDLTGRIRPSLLNPKRRADWCDCRIQALLGTGRTAQALAIGHDLPDRFPHHRHRFLTHLLRTYLLLDSPYDAAAVYVELSHHRPPPAWVFFEHGRLERDVGRIGDAVVLLSRALLITRPLVGATAVLEDLAELMLKLGWCAAARDHLRLNAWLREVHGRLVPDRLRDLYDKAVAGCRNRESAVPDRNAILTRCRAIWRHQASRRLPVRRDVNHTRRYMGNRRGTILQEGANWLIRVMDGPDFPIASDLVPAGIEAGARVRFDAVPSFDRDRRIETWKVVRLRPAAFSPSDPEA